MDEFVIPCAVRVIILSVSTLFVFHYIGKLVVSGNYHSSDRPCPRGEIWLGGGSIAVGYYKNPEKTAEEFHTVNGKRWFSTGDIGLIEPDGSLRIIGANFIPYVEMQRMEMFLLFSLVPFVSYCLSSPHTFSHFLCLLSISIFQLSQTNFWLYRLVIYL